jgi:RpiR family transcriptional regulator, carbohydrate utilization regulator
MDKRINILTQLKTMTLDMTESERLIAEYILNNPEEVFNLKIENLSKKLNVSLPTVFRFSKKLGFKGFKDFKVALIRDMAIGMNIEIENIDEDSIESTTINVFEKIRANLKETLSLINYDDLARAVDILTSSKRIIFFAVSYSASVALDAYAKFLSAGFNSIYDTETYTQRVISTQCTPKDVAIGISFSGASREVVDCMKNAKQNGANTIGLTAFIKSPITEFSRLCIYTAPVHARYQRIDLASKMSFAAILDSLYINAVLKKRESALEYISRTEEELGKYNRTFQGLKGKKVLD